MTTPVSAHSDGKRFWDELRVAVGGAVVGQTAALRQIAIGLLAHGHVLIEDVPGVGKTLLARAVAKALDLDLPTSDRLQVGTTPQPNRSTQRTRLSRVRAWQCSLRRCVSFT